MKAHTIIDSPLGELTLVNTDGVLSGLYMERTRRLAQASLGQRTGTGFERATEQLHEYFSGQRTGFDIPLAPVGGVFDRRVWDVVSRIPYGQTRSYAQVAGELGERDWEVVRAVGAANGRNPICIVIPCHRVIGSDGSLTGYAGGLSRKEYLLALENPARLTAPALF